MNEYTPKRVSPPGATLLDLLNERTMSAREFADEVGWSVQKVKSIISGKYRITDVTASSLEDVTGIPALFWIEREKRYRESLDR